jgi:apolipoprotein N-acyltransferase
MAKEGFFSGIGKIKSISFGIVYIMFSIWLIFHTKQYVPPEQVDMWWNTFVAYGILQAVIFGNADLRNKLFDISILKFLPRFCLFFLGSGIIFVFLSKGVDLPINSFLGILANIPLWLAAIHALVFATTESVIWQGFLDYKLGQPWSALSAGLFHWGFWAGSIWLVTLSAGLLFLFFSLINWYFRKSKADVTPAIGVHTAYNLVKLGIAFGG